MNQADTVGPSPRKILKRSEQDSDEDIQETQKALEEIDSCQNEIDGLNEKASEEMLKVEQKYNKLRKPYFDRRNTIIEKIPNFWVTAFIHHPVLSDAIEKEDIICLEFLKKLEVEEFEDIKSGYSIKFFFEENPFFENDSLVKEFHLGSSGDPKSTSTDIQWKVNMDLSKKEENVMTMRRKRGLEAKTFFSWYNDHGDPTADHIAKAIKTELWLKPQLYYSTDLSIPLPPRPILGMVYPALNKKGRPFKSWKTQRAQGKFKWLRKPTVKYPPVSHIFGLGSVYDGAVRTLPDVRVAATSKKAAANNSDTLCSTNKKMRTGDPNCIILPDESKDLVDLDVTVNNRYGRDQIRQVLNNYDDVLCVATETPLGPSKVDEEMQDDIIDEFLLYEQELSLLPEVQKALKIQKASMADGDKPRVVGPRGAYSMVCKKCGLQMLTNRAFAVHVANSCDDKPFKCQEEACSKTFKTRSELIQHGGVHITEKRFKCQACSKTFKTKRELTKHGVVHKTEKPFKCQACSKTFKREHELKAHSLRHVKPPPLKPPPVQCQACSKTFKRENNLKAHSLKVHSLLNGKPLPPPQLQCQFCQVLFREDARLRSHISKFHSASEN